MALHFRSNNNILLLTYPACLVHDGCIAEMLPLSHVYVHTGDSAAAAQIQPAISFNMEFDLDIYNNYFTTLYY